MTIMNAKHAGSKRTGLEIAVIGMAGRFPGAANLSLFWDNLIKGEESICFFSNQELIASGIQAESLQDDNYVKAAGVLENIENFDAAFFGYKKNEANELDPQVRLFLECAWEALEDAGYETLNYPGLVGVFVGASPNWYWENRLHRENYPGDRLPHFNTPQYLELPGRVSYRLDLEGPSSFVYCGSATSLAAIRQACQAILTGDCQMAIAGGVTVTIPQVQGYRYLEGGFFSFNGHCRAFAAGAGGTVPASGAGSVVLKLLTDAIKDRDNIYAVIKSAVLTTHGAVYQEDSAPETAGQSEAIQRALEMADIQPETIGYIETNGMGIDLWDQAEIEAMTTAFKTDQKQFCAIGSVKSNIGHLDCAAGIAAFIKAVLAIKYKRIPPSLHFDPPNPHIDFENTPFFVNTELIEWVRRRFPLRAGVSAFDRGGTNVHIILEEAPKFRSQGRKTSAPTFYLLLLSARTDTALKIYARNLVAFLMKNPFIDMADAAYTLQIGRREFKHRLMLVCADANEAVGALNSLQEPSQLHIGKVRTFFSHTSNPPVIFMFTGPGAQYIDMGLDLYQEEKFFREQMDLCFAILRPILGYDLKTVLYPHEPVAGAYHTSTARRFQHPEVILTSLFIIQYSLARLLSCWGIKPHAMIGYGFGEYASACFAGVISVEEALELLVCLGRLMEKMTDDPMLNPAHSALMDPILEDYKIKVDEMYFNNPGIPYISSTTGTWITPAQAMDPGYWVNHLRETICFADGIKELGKKRNAIFLEIGPGRELSLMVQRQLESHPLSRSINLMRSADEEGPDSRYLLDKIGRLWLYGEFIDWPAFYTNEKRQRISLPTYPFERTPYWPALQTQPSTEPEIEKKPTEETLPLQTIQPAETVQPFESIQPFESSETVELIEPINTILPSPGPGPLKEKKPLLTEEPIEPVPFIIDEEEEEEPIALEPVELEEIEEELEEDIEEELIETQPPRVIEPGINEPGPDQWPEEEEPFLEPGVMTAPPGTPVPIEPPEPLDSFGPFELDETEPFSITPVEEQDYYPLTPAQEYWYHNSSQSRESVYMIRAIELHGILDGDRLETVCTAIIERHDSLRTSFIEVAGQPVQRIHKNVELKIQYFGGPFTDNESSAEDTHPEIETSRDLQQMVDEFSGPFVLSTPPLVRIGCLSLDVEESRFLLLVVFHPIVADEPSWECLLQEFTVLYSGDELPGLEIQYKDYAAWLAGERQGSVYKQAETYWLGRFPEPVPGLNLPEDVPTPGQAVKERRAVDARADILIPSGTLELFSPRTDKDALKGINRVVLAIYAVFLARLSGHEDVVTAMPVSGRSLPELETMVGHFVNYLPLRLHPVNNKTVRDFIQETGREISTALAHQVFRLEESVQRVPFDTVFHFHSRPAVLPEEIIPGLEVRSYDLAYSTGAGSIRLECREIEDGVRCTFSIDSRCSGPQTAARWSRCFLTLFEAAAHQLDSKIGDLDMIPPDDKKALLEVFNDTFADYPRERTSWELLVEQVVKTPDHVAMVSPYPGLTLDKVREVLFTYRRLYESSSYIAALLQETGVGPGTIVAILLDSTVYWLPVVLGILKTGSAYLPIDPLLPPEQLRAILNDSLPHLLITSESLAVEAVGICQTLQFEDLDLETPLATDLFPSADNNNAAVEPPSVSPAIILYSIRDDGCPIGVVIGQGALVNLCYWHNHEFQVNTHDHTAVYSDPGHDAAVWEFLPYLIAGSTVYLPCHTIKQDVKKLGDYFHERAISIAFLPYGVCEAFIKGENHSLRVLLTTGRRLREFPPGDYRLINCYGQPESSLVSCSFRVYRPNENIPIGIPIDNTRLYVLDPWRRLLPPGVPGRLYISGNGLALGYLNRPELTADRFLSPGTINAKDLPEETLFQTSHQVRWLPGGVLQFIGPVPSGETDE